MLLIAQVHITNHKPITKDYAMTQKFLNRITMLLFTTQLLCMSNDTFTMSQSKRSAEQADNIPMYSHRHSDSGRFLGWEAPNSSKPLSVSVPRKDTPRPSSQDAQNKRPVNASSKSR